MATLIDSYSETNQNNNWAISGDAGANGTMAGQSFTNTNSINLTSCKFYLRKAGSPTGNAVAKLYAHSGTYGTSSVGTGSALSTSDNFDVSTLTTSHQLIEFTFSTPYTMSASTYYVIVFEYTGGSAANQTQVGYDNATLSHGGNGIYYKAVWGYDNAIDTCFYVYGTVTTNTSNFFQLF